MSYRIDQRQLIAEIGTSEPVLKQVAEQVMKESFFNPAVAKLRDDFKTHKVTEEIAGGKSAINTSNTLEGDFRKNAKKGDVTPNLWGFIGFDAAQHTPDSALEPIAERLNPENKDGPKMAYLGKDRQNLIFRWRIEAPNEEAIYNDKRTHFFWAPGISWVKRIEQGIPGISHFLNSARPSSRSGGGIQVDGVVRSGGRFKPVSYLSQIFNNFLRRVTGRVDNGRSV